MTSKAEIHKYQMNWWKNDHKCETKDHNQRS